MKKQSAIFLLFLTAFLWSLGGLLIKLAEWPSPAIAGFRSLVAFLILVPFVRHTLRIPQRAELVGALLYALTLYTFVVATRMTTAANAIVLQYSAPMYVALLAPWLLKERVRQIDALFIVWTFVGIILFFFDQLSPASLVGTFIAIISGLCFAGLIISLRMLKTGEPLLAVWYGNMLVFLLSLLSGFPPAPSLQTTLVIVLLGTLQIALPYLLYSKIIKYVGALDAVLVLTLEPILNPLWVMLVLGERPGPCALVGSVVVILAVLTRSVLVVREQRVSSGIKGPLPVFE